MAKADLSDVGHASYGLAGQPDGEKGGMFHYVYMLESCAHAGRHYVGLTNDLKERLQRHNAGDVAHTRRYRPWRVRAAVAMGDRQRAASFEQYLKTASGRAFAKKHF